MYLYTPLDGEPYTSEEEPTDGDFEMIADGQLDVIYMEFYDGIHLAYVFKEEGEIKYGDIAEGVRMLVTDTGEEFTVCARDVGTYRKEGWEFI